MKFVHLNVKSYYSMMYGTASPEQICIRLQELGIDTIALTDTNGLYGLHFFLDDARHYKIKVIIGTEIIHENERALLLAKNEKGYREICKCLTKKYNDENFRLKEYLKEHSKDLIILTDNKNLLSGLKTCPDLYVELQGYRDHHTLQKIAHKNNLEMVATSPAIFLDKEDFVIHKHLRAIHLNTTIDRVPDSELASPENMLRGSKEMMERFSHVPEAVENTVTIAGKCKTDWDFSEIIFPNIFKNYEALNILKEKCEQGLSLRYKHITKEIQDRLDYELDIIKDMGYSQYFLLVQDIVKESKLTCGRGSGAASIVSYCLFITHVDPIKHNLFFERFINRGRKDLPDIDVDFAWDERDDILDYIFEKYKDRSAMVSNHVHLKPRAAFREVSKVYGMPKTEIDFFSSRLKYLWGIQDVGQVIKTHPMFQDVEPDETWLEILNVSMKVAGVPRHMSVHCGGVIITDRKLENHAVIEKATKGVPVIQWEKDQTEMAGLVKIDILGNRSLAVIRDALQAIKLNYNVAINYKYLNAIEDLRTQQAIKRGLTFGCFYVESPATRLLLQKCKSGDFENLVVVSSIIRPAANDMAREYVRRLYGGTWKPIHPILEKVLEETFGIMVYQEDVSRVAVALANFTPDDGDELRKVMTKKHKKRKLKDFFEKFVHGCRANDVKDDVIEKIWAMMLSFEGYSFCKPHSASYALVSFKAAYVRSHYPAEFFASVISNMGGFYSTFAYLSEAKRLGLKVLGPDINESEKQYTGINDKIRIGFMQIMDLQGKAVDALVHERKQGKFTSLENFLARMTIDQSDVIVLIKSGCFDSISGKTRPELMWTILLSKKKEEQLTIYEDSFEIPVTTEYNEMTVLRHEVETLGFLVSRHPLTLYTKQLANMNYIQAKYLHKYVGKYVAVIGWYVTSKLTSTKNQEPMQFLSFEDTTAIYETTFFPKTCQKFCHMITKTKPYILKGYVDEDFSAVTLNVMEVEIIGEKRKPVKKPVEKDKKVRWNYHPI